MYNDIKGSIPLNTPFRAPGDPLNIYHVLYKDPEFIGEIRVLSGSDLENLGEDDAKKPNDWIINKTVGVSQLLYGRQICGFSTGVAVGGVVLCAPAHKKQR